MSGSRIREQRGRRHRWRSRSFAKAGTPFVMSSKTGEEEVGGGEGLRTTVCPTSTVFFDFSVIYRRTTVPVVYRLLSFFFLARTECVIN